MSGAQTFEWLVNEDGSFSILARVCSLDGTGELVRDEEGYCLKRADVSAVSAKVFDLGADEDNPAGVEVTPAPSVSAAANFSDALQTVGWPTGRDWAGYNFRVDLGPTFTAKPDNWYTFELKVTTVGGAVGWLRGKHKTVPVQTS